MLERCHRLERVADLVDQVVDQMIDFLVLSTSDPDQLVLNVTREQSLRGLQQLLHDELVSASASEDTVWRIVSSVLATVVAYLADCLSNSIPYKRGCEQSGSTFLSPTRLLTVESDLGD